MITLWLLGLFITTLINVIRRKYKFNTLGCGMVGYCGDKPGDPNILKMLLMFNLERGEDSTGWAVNNKITKDTEKVSKFLAKNDLIISEDDENFTFIAHARKASSGAKTKKELAHPFGVYRGEAEKDNFDLILAMNGTMSNVYDFAKHFDLKYVYNDNSDTQILSRAMCKLGDKEYVKAIEGIDGAATLLFFTPKVPNSLMVYKDPQRDLFYWQKSKTEIYVSSIEDSLYAVGGNLKTVNAFKDGHLYRMLKGRITSDKEITRNSIKFVAPANVSNFNRSSYEGNYGKNWGIQQGSTNMFKNAHELKGKSTVDVYPYNVEENKKKNAGYIHCMYDKYYRNGHPITDYLLLDKDGKEYKEGDKEGYNMAYFITGFLVKDKESYEILRKRFNDGLGNFQLKKFKEVPLSQICNYFAFPAIAFVDLKQKWLLNQFWGKNIKSIGDTVEYTMPYTNLKYELKYDGIVIENDGMADIKTTVISNVTDISKVQEPSKDIVLKDARNLHELEIGKPFEDLVKETIATIEFLDSASIYTKVRNVLWQANADNKLKEFFYRAFLSLLLKEGIIDEQNRLDITDRGERVNWTSGNNSFANDISNCIRKYRKILNQQLPVITVTAETDIKQDLNDEDISEDILVTDKKIVESMKESNDFFSHENFKDDFYSVAYDDIANYEKDYLADYEIHSLESRKFCEAILLCLNVIGKLNETEVIEISKLTEKELKGKTEGQYRAYVREMKSKEEDAPPTEGVQAGLREEVEFEDYTPEQYEKDQEDVLSDTRESLNVVIRDIEMIPEGLRTERVKEMLETYKAVRQDIENALFPQFAV